MYTLVVDDQVVSGVDSPMFTMLQQSPVSALATLTNEGDNIIGYHFQQNAAGTWSDISSLGSPLNNTLSPGQVASVAIVSAYPQVRLMALASGGSSLNFGVSRYSCRAAHGIIPILNF